MLLFYLHSFFFFFFNDTATTEIYTLSLHDALPISIRDDANANGAPIAVVNSAIPMIVPQQNTPRYAAAHRGSGMALTTRSEEHTSELQSHLNLVCRLLLEKKKKKSRVKMI